MPTPASSTRRPALVPGRRRAPRHARPSHRGRNAALAAAGAFAISGLGLLGVPSVTGAQAAITPTATTPAVAPAAPAAPVPTVTQDGPVGPAAMVAGKAATASLSLHSSACFTAKTVGVGVRDARGRNLDFPGHASDVRICPNGFDFTSAARTLPAGTYTQFGFWQDLDGTWHDLPSQRLVVSAAGASTRAPATTAG
ncbi:hypothetical protein [Kitasatospora brasiliensis]|uniref:hypothetical protein n=1 Tax=Kitasatospora brasiliensis TaxID=3058040 RepID=UPI002931D377|nr:hypothetical protein [Kitasatospora sp. K002]